MLNEAEKYFLQCHRQGRKPSGKKIHALDQPIDKEKVYREHKGDHIDNTCQESSCNKPTKFDSFSKGYRKFCSKKCYSKNLSEKNKANNKTLNKIRSERLAIARKNLLETLEDEYVSDPTLKISNLAKKAGLPYSAVREHLSRLGNSEGRKRVNFKYATIKEQLSELDRTERKQKTAKYLAENFSCSPNFISSSLRDLGKPLLRGSRSTEEKFICDHLQSLKVSHETNNRSIINPLEIDILIPSKKLAIEVNGVYWHQHPRKHKTYHLEKTQACAEIGYKCIHFFDYEIHTKRGIVTSIINNNLGLSKKIWARTCAVKNLDNETYRDFLEKNHIQGHVGASIKLGLFHNDELVSCMSFGKNRFREGFELLRFCNRTNITVVGGASKLFRHFIKENSNVDQIISYCSRRMYDGTSYHKMGFKKVGESPPNYFWVNNKNDIKTRYQTQKHKLKTNLTEVEHMTALGYYRVYDCGNLVFEWTK